MTFILEATDHLLKYYVVDRDKLPIVLDITAIIPRSSVNLKDTGCSCTKVYKVSEQSTEFLKDNFNPNINLNKDLFVCDCFGALISDE